jgi:beta propeller repeat protein
MKWLKILSGAILILLLMYPVIGSEIHGISGNNLTNNTTYSIISQNISSLHPETNSIKNLSSGNLKVPKINNSQNSSGSLKDKNFVNYGSSLGIENYSDNSTDNQTDLNQTIPGVIEPSILSGQDNDPVQILSVHENGPYPAAIGTETILTPGIGDTNHGIPAISGDTIIWINKKGNNLNLEIFNLVTGEEKSIPVERTGSFFDPPAISSDTVIFMSEWNSIKTLFSYTISEDKVSQLPVSSDGSIQYSPAIDGNNIVYLENNQNGNSQVVLYNLVSGIKIPLSNMTDNSNQYSPSISGNNVVWYDDSGGKSSIHLCNITTGVSKILVQDTGDFYHWRPSIDKEKIVWSDYRDQNYDIYLYDLFTGNETLLTPGTNMSDQMKPAIDNDLVVWEDYRNLNPEISLYNLTSGEEFTIGMQGSDKQRPKIRGNRIVWQDTRNGNTDIFLFTLGEIRPTVSANFSVNRTIEQVPVTLSFFDNSAGNPTSYSWDFGDGNCSSDKNPVYTYYEPGLYTISLTVWNSWSRDAKVIPDYITVGTVPHANFSFNPPSGPAPLTVQFNDISTGQPNAWHWDFGDGSSSDEQNPVHIFINPGNYTVCLNCVNQFGNSSTTRSMLAVPATWTQNSLKIPGLLLYSPDTGYIGINSGLSPGYQFTLENNGSQLNIIPVQNNSGLKLVLFTPDEAGFYALNGTFSGNLSSVQVISGNLTSQNFDSTLGPEAWVNFTAMLPWYNPDGSINTGLSQEITPDEYNEYKQIIYNSNYASAVDSIAYVLHFTEENISGTGPATVTMSVGHDWVLQNSPYIMPKDRFKVEVFNGDGNYMMLNTLFEYSDPVNRLDYYLVTSPDSFNISNLYLKQYNSSLSFNDSRMVITDPTDPAIENTKAITIAVDSDWVYWNNPGIWDNLYEPVTILHIDNQGNGEVLNTGFLYFDDVNNLDVFAADSPKGLSDFALTTVSRSGNPLQLLYLSLSSRVSPPPVPPKNSNSGDSSGGGGGGGSYGGNGNPVTSAVQPDASTASQSETSREGSSVTVLSNDGQSKSISIESASPGQPPANSLPPVSIAPAVNPPALPPQPTNSIFTMLIEVAAMVSVILIVVFSVSIRYRQREKE